MNLKAKAKSSNLAEKSVVRILIVDDHPVVRHGLAQLLQQQSDLQIVGEASNAPEALKQIELVNPDLVIVDVSLAGGSGIELIKQIKARDPNIKMLVQSFHDESLYAERALHAGAMGYVNKQVATTKIIEAIRQVLRGEVYLSSPMANRMLRRVVGGQDELKRSSMDTLSDRELEVFDLIGKGMTTRDIAEKLHLSPKTIETHRENIKTKLKLRNSVELVRHAVQWAMEEG